MKIAFADLLFSWPPHGGANVDLFQVIKTLGESGHDVKLFALRQTGSPERGAFVPGGLPFPAEALEAGPALDAKRIATLFRDAIGAWHPEVVFVGCGFLLKPFVIEALAHYPLAVRYYSYEAVCHRDILQYKNGAPCAENYLDHPDICRQCALEHLAPALKHVERSPWLEEYRAAEAYAPEYHARLCQALRHAGSILVSNPRMAQQVEAYCPAIIVPGGVALEDFPCCPPPQNDKKIILMTGRGEDPAKGLAVLLAAGEKLAGHRDDFEIHATLPEDTAGPSWFKALGWCTHAETAALYRDASLCAVPSIWEEPFGLTAVEAMATGRPVCASRVGGLQHIVAEGETGFLTDPGDADALAASLERLLDDDALRQSMGAAGRQRAETEYAWPKVIKKHYLPILERLAAAERA